MEVAEAAERRAVHAIAFLELVVSTREGRFAAHQLQQRHLIGYKGSAIDDLTKKVIITHEKIIQIFISKHGCIEKGIILKYIQRHILG